MPTYESVWVCMCMQTHESICGCIVSIRFKLKAGIIYPTLNQCEMIGRDWALSQINWTSELRLTIDLQCDLRQITLPL